MFDPNLVQNDFLCVWREYFFTVKELLCFYIISYKLCGTLLFCVGTFGSILSHHMAMGCEDQGRDQEITTLFLFFFLYHCLLRALGDL